MGLEATFSSSPPECAGAGGGAQEGHEKKLKGGGKVKTSFAVFAKAPFNIFFYQLVLFVDVSWQCFFWNAIKL